MQYRLRTLFLVFVFVASSVGAFGPWGLAVAAYLLVLLVAVRMMRTRRATILEI